MQFGTTGASSMESRRSWIGLGAGTASREILLIRAAVGSVFLTSGLLKFLYENQGVGRFTKIGLPAPATLATLVGVVEIAGGACLLVGLATRLAALPLVIDMLMALATTKVPLLFGVGPEPVNAPPKTGLWAFLYQSRLDVTMLLACLFLALVGAGAWSLDHWLATRRSAAATASTARVAA